MPLHAKRKTLRAFNGNGFNRAVNRASFRDEAICLAGDPLTVKRVYHDLPCAEQFFEEAALPEHHIMYGAVLDTERIILVLAVVHARRVARFGWFLMDMLMQRAAKGDIHFLIATAEGEKRHGALRCGADEAQRQRIALAVAQHAVAGRGTAVILRMDVRV